jgi:serine/threonine protein kinase
MNIVEEKVTEVAAPRFGRYVCTGILGKGAMGTVFLADDPVLERKIALKVISLDPSLDKTTREEYFVRFSFEAKASARLNHPSIVPVYDTGSENGIPWIAFQYIEGETLDKMLRRREKLPIKRVVAFSLDIASALQHAHGWSIVHRDIKPANILIENSTGIAKLTDFGIIKAPWVSATQEGKTLGSPGYMSPEQIQGHELDLRADLFCLGVVMYQMITGTHPFLRDSIANTLYATCQGAYTPLRDCAKEVPLALEKAVRRCLAVDRRMRMASADDLMDFLKNIPAPDRKTASKKVTVLSSCASGGTRFGLSAKPRAVSGLGLSDFLQKGQSAANIFLTKVNSFVYVLKLLWLEVKQRIVPAFITTSEKIYSLGVNCWNRRLLVRMRERETIKALSDQPVTSLIMYWGSLAAIVIIITIVAADYMINSSIRPRSGTDEARLMAQCRIALDNNDRRNAIDAAHALTAMKTIHPYTKTLLVRVQIRDGKYVSATETLKKMRTSSTDRKALKNALPAIAGDVLRQLKKGKAPIDLLDLAVYIIPLTDSSPIHSWVGDTNYWLRWNAVDIFQISNQPVDIVPVYIVDVFYGPTEQIRLQAIKKLGASTDSRVVRTLIQVRELGEEDPVVSAEAARVLDERFR